MKEAVENRQKRSTEDYAMEGLEYQVDESVVFRLLHQVDSKYLRHKDCYNKSLLFP